MKRFLNDVTIDYIETKWARDSEVQREMSETQRRYARPSRVISRALNDGVTVGPVVQHRLSFPLSSMSSSSENSYSWCPIVVKTGMFSNQEWNATTISRVVFSLFYFVIF